MEDGPDSQRDGEEPAALEARSSVSELERPLLEHSNNETEEPSERDETSQTEERVPRQSPAIAWAPTTPLLAKIVIPLLALLTSGLFYYGQSSNMWKLTSDYTVSISYKASGVQTRLLMEALSLPTSDTIHRESVWDIQYFTYSYWVEQLWLAQGMPNKILPRFASIGLVLCSGVWPHLKIVLLLGVWWLTRKMVRQQFYLHWLSVLGKWSLVDVFVVCVLVGVLHLAWEFEAAMALQQLLAHWDTVATILRALYSTEDLCTMALHFDCHHPKTVIHTVDCRACHSAVEGFLAYPSPILNGLTVSGGGHGRMVVKGLHGIYAFCGAVVASIVLGAIVDSYLLKHWHSQSVAENDESSNNVPQADTDSDADEEQPLVEGIENGDSRTDSDRLHDEQRIRLPRFRIEIFDRVLWSIFSLAVLGLVLFASSSVTLERNVSGVLPNLLQDLLGVVWAESYSFVNLGWTMRGGWDYLLMGTFCCFMILGPILRGALCTLVSCVRVGAPMVPIEFLHTIIDIVGAFCAWEVFTVAAVMVALVMPDMTATIITDPRCQLVAQDSDSSCLEVELDLNRLWKVVGSGILLFVVSQRARSFLHF